MALIPMAVKTADGVLVHAWAEGDSVQFNEDGSVTFDAVLHPGRAIFPKTPAGDDG